MIHDLEKWELQLAEFHRCGGDQLSDKAMILTAHDMLPGGTDPSVHTTIQTANTYE